MVIDTSSLICILLNEPEALVHANALASESKPVISAVNWLETMIVINSRLGESGTHELGKLLALTKTEIIQVDSAVTQRAFDGWQRFGKGRHPAALNFGDCFSYALAQERREPLLFKGNDFSRTDVLCAVKTT
ncbi:MAG: hypothetical protein RLZZ226_1947 [Pseudomonadota bacterium]|jgi:ribonuclease VapC